MKPYDQQTDEELMGLAGVQGGAHLESMLRLRVAVEKQSHASGRLTWAIIALMVVQIAIAVVKVR